MLMMKKKIKYLQEGETNKQKKEKDILPTKERKETEYQVAQKLRCEERVEFDASEY